MVGPHANKNRAPLTTAGTRGVLARANVHIHVFGGCLLLLDRRLPTGTFALMKHKNKTRFTRRSFGQAGKPRHPTLAAQRVLSYELQKPVPPSPDACCGNGCRVCVYDKFDIAMERYEEQQRQLAGLAASPTNISGDYAQLVSTMMTDTPATMVLLPSPGKTSRFDNDGVIIHQMAGLALNVSSAFVVDP